MVPTMDKPPEAQAGARGHDHARESPTDFTMNPYIDAIKRIPPKHRMEAYFMFEIFLRATDCPLRPSELMEAVSCAGLESLDECVRALAETRTKTSQGLDYSSWLEERGAGLLEFVVDPNNHGHNNKPRVRFRHQTILDFVSQPGFRDTILGHSHSLPLENGYSVLAKWLLARTQESIERGTLEPPVTAPAVDILARAESITGRSMKSFLDALDTRIIQREFESLGLCEPITEPKMAFAILQNLTLTLHEYIAEHDGTIPDRGDLSLLHCLCDVVARLPVLFNRPGSKVIFPFTMPVDVPIASILLRHGAKVDAVYGGKTPWQLLFQFSHSDYRRFRHESGLRDPSPVNALAGHLLRAGHDPNADILMARVTEGEEGVSTEFIIGKALHIATEDLAKLLLEFGAKVNALDRKGRTPLDLACGVPLDGGQLKGEFARYLEDAYALATLLIQHGGKVTSEGQRQWPVFLAALRRARLDVPDEVQKPGVLRLSKAMVLTEKLRRFKARVKEMADVKDSEVSEDC